MVWNGHPKSVVCFHYRLQTEKSRAGQHITYILVTGKLTSVHFLYCNIDNDYREINSQSKNYNAGTNLSLMLAISVS